MNSEEKIVIDFSLPFNVQKVFDFIVLPSNMPLYQGFFLVPGIRQVDSSDTVRKTGTIDRISNVDGSTHESVTDVLVPGARYTLTLQNIKITGYKKSLATPITGFREDWIFHSKSGCCQIERTLVIFYKKGFLSKLLVRFFIRPQIEQSLLKHHKNILKSMLT